MENQLLSLKKTLLEELETKKSIINAQKERTTYIELIEIQLEQKYYELMEKQISFYDFNKYIKSINQNIIYKYITENIEMITYRLSKEQQYNNTNPKSVEKFYIELGKLMFSLKDIKQQKNTQILIKEQQIEEINQIINNIDENGKLINPLTSNQVDILKKNAIKIYKDDKQYQNIFLAITLLNNQAIKERLTKLNAQKIRQNRKRITQPIKQTIEKNIPPTLDNNQQQIYDLAKKIIEENINIINIPNETEETYIEELKNETNITEIKTAIEIMANSENKIVLIIYGLKQKLETLKQETLEQDFKIIKTYINEFNKNIENQQEQQRIKQKQEQQLKIIYNDYLEIKDTIENEVIFEELTNIQIKSLESLGDIKDESEDILKDIEETLKKVELNVEFLILYNKYKEIQNQLKEYEEFEEILEPQEKQKQIEQIIKEYKKYENIKNNYLQKEQIENTKQEEKEENILLYLTDENDITYAQKQIEDGKQFSEIDYYQLKQLIRELKENNFSYIHAVAKKVKPYEPDYKKKRLSQGEMRLIFIPLSNKPLETEKKVYLVICAGTKTETNNAPIYDAANHLKRKVIEFTDAYKEQISKKTKQEKLAFIEKNKQIEQTLLNNVDPTKSGKLGGKSNGK